MYQQTIIMEANRLIKLHNWYNKALFEGFNIYFGKLFEFLIIFYFCQKSLRKVFLEGLAMIVIRWMYDTNYINLNTDISSVVDFQITLSQVQAKNKQTSILGWKARRGEYITWRICKRIRPIKRATAWERIGTRKMQVCHPVT